MKARSTMECMWAARKKATAGTHGLMDRHSKENGSITVSMAKAFTCGKMAADTTVNGKITIWRATESTTGPMVEDMRGNITTIRNADTGFTTGPMAAFMKAGGTKGSSMASECISILRRRRSSTAFGKTEKE